MSNSSRYIIGIDLGTTNCALAYVDCEQENSEVTSLPIPQLIAPGEVKALPALPSFIYLPDNNEIERDLYRLPWSGGQETIAVGTFARENASKTPGKVVSSAKSWLCCEGVDRTADILPFDKGNINRQISPVEAAHLYLDHLKNAWDHQMATETPEHAMEKQEIYLTVPASFDAVARELTVLAAEESGLHVTLLEEPQAAFYAWLEKEADSWRDHVEPGSRILVCDIGGGTTDFSLISAKDLDGNLELERIAVGDHILLGGDNMDLTLAYGVSQRLKEERNTNLDAYQLTALTHACRSAKEHLTSAENPETQTLTILGRGSSLIGGTIKTELTPEETKTRLIDGFFPSCDSSAVPNTKKRMGLRTLGLDYAADPAITRHLAAFISRHCTDLETGDLTIPTTVLFNGGVTKSNALTGRIVGVLNSWLDGETVDVLTSANLDLAVSFGAASYGNVRRHGGVRIKAGSARSYYLGIESSMPAIPGFEPPVDLLCMVNFGMEEGTSADIPSTGLGLIVGEPTEFRVFSSTNRPEDPIGLELSENQAGPEIEELPPLATTLEATDISNAIGSLVPVNLHVVLTEIGTLQIWCRQADGNGEWKLEFEIRDND